MNKSNSDGDLVRLFLQLQKRLLAWVEPHEVDRLAYEDVLAIQLGIDFDARGITLDPQHVQKRAALTYERFLGDGGGELLNTYLAQCCSATIDHVREVLRGVPFSSFTSDRFSAALSAFRTSISERCTLRAWDHGFDKSLDYPQVDYWEKLMEEVLLKPYMRQSHYLLNQLDSTSADWQLNRLGRSITEDRAVVVATKGARVPTARKRTIEMRLEEVPGAWERWMDLLRKEGLVDTTGSWIGPRGGKGIGKLIAAWDAAVEVLRIPAFVTDAALSKAMQEQFPEIQGLQRIDRVRKYFIYHDRLEQYAADLREH